MMSMDSIIRVAQCAPATHQLSSSDRVHDRVLSCDLVFVSLSIPTGMLRMGIRILLLPISFIEPKR